MNKKSIILFLALCVILIFTSCQNDFDSDIQKNAEEIANEANTKALADEITEPIEPFEIDSAIFAQYLEFKKENKLKLVQLMSSDISVKNNELPKYSDYYFESTLGNNIYAIRDLPITITSRGGTNRVLSTNGKGKELIFLSTPPRNNGRGRVSPTHEFYFRAFPGSTGVPYVLYSYVERTPISVGRYSKDPDNPVLFTNDDEKGSFIGASFSFYPVNGYLRWESDILVAGGDSGSVWDIYYKAAENRNNKTGFSQYTGNASQEWIFTPLQKFDIDDLQFCNSFNTSVVRQGTEKITGGEKNEFYNSPMPNVNVYFPFKCKETSHFIENKGINFILEDGGKKFRLPTIINGQINTFPSQSDPYVAIYSDTEQTFMKDFYSFIGTSLEPRTKFEATYTYHWYDVEVDYTLKISTSVKSISESSSGGRGRPVTVTKRETTLNGVWKGRIWTDERDPVYYKFIDLNTNELIEEGYQDISNLSKTANLVKMTKTKTK